MNIADVLIKEHSLKNTKLISNYICNNTSELKQLLQIFESNNQRLIQRAAWPLLHIANTKICLFLPYIPYLITLLKKPFHSAVKRNVLRVLASLPIKEQYLGKLVNLSFGFLFDPKEPVAIKVYAMQILYNATLKHPDLKQEVILAIQHNLTNGSAGILSRGHKLIKLLKKI